MQHEGDVFLFQTLDDGDIKAQDGIVEMSGGLRTAAYLSLFGGEPDWWFNLLEPDPEVRLTARTQTAIDTLVPVPANLARIQQAAEADLAWMISRKVASAMTVVASIPALDRLRLRVNIDAVGEPEQFEFIENWRAQS